MSFMQQVFATANWLAGREFKPVDGSKRRINAYNRGLSIGGRTTQIPFEAAEHVRKLETKKVTPCEKENCSPIYDQSQVDFWRNHTHELYDIIMNRSSAFMPSSYADTGLAINFFAA